MNFTLVFLISAERFMGGGGVRAHGSEENKQLGINFANAVSMICKTCKSAPALSRRSNSQSVLHAQSYTCQLD